MPPRLTFTPTQWATVVAHLQHHWPHEACGLLGGNGHKVEKVFLIENIRHSPVEYEMHPEQMVRAMVEMETLGWDLVGIFHSHPAGPPTPSATDVTEAYYPEALYLICSPTPQGQWQGRVFRIADERVEEGQVIVTADVL